MSRVPYHVIAARVQQEMYTVEIDLPCPVCEEVITVDVIGGDDVELITACDLKCHRESGYPWDAMEARAIGRAQSERADYEQHLRDQGQ